MAAPPTRRFLLATLGSTGDVHPFLALGAALHQAGHGVTLLADPKYRAAASLAQIDFAPIPAKGPGPDMNQVVERMLKTSSQIKQVEALYAGLAPVFGDLLDATQARLPEHDVLVSSYLFPFLKNVARQAGKKCAVLVFCPNNVPFIDAGPEAAPRAPRWTPKLLRRQHHRLGWAIGQKLLLGVVARQAGPELQKRGLGKFRGFLRDPADRALVTVSKKLFPPPGPLPKKYVQTGFLRWHPAMDEKAAADLARVAAVERRGGPLPLLTFGSMATADVRAQFSRLLAAWPRGAPLVVQSGGIQWQGEAARPEVLVIGPVPHESLFERATLVIHHGGAGTTAAALHAGRPQIIIPHLGDQWYWAQTTQKLGVAHILQRETWPEQLAAMVAEVLRDISMVRRAIECAVIIRAENGAAQAVSELEKL
jgi:vancomycin aglycone glucosyltransferase